MVQAYSTSTMPDFRPAKRTLKDTVKLAVNRTLKPKRQIEDDTNTLASASQIESECSTLIEFSVGSEQAWHPSGSAMTAYEAPQHRVWPVIVPEHRIPSRDEVMRLSPDVDTDTASIETQTLDPEDNAWGPPRRSTLKSSRQNHSSKLGIFGRRSHKP